jgi:hypothetical protein
LSAEEIKALAAHAKAFGPSPANGAQDAGTPLLTWKPREAALWHDVYLGTDPNLTSAHQVASRLPVAMYWHVPGLTPGTTYYWRVDEIDPDETRHTGDVWSFFYAPKEAYHPTPGDGEPFTDPNLTLSWMGGLGAVSHDVFSANKAAVAEGTGSTFKGNPDDDGVPARILTLTRPIPGGSTKSPDAASQKAAFGPSGAASDRGGRSEPGGLVDVRRRRARAQTGRATAGGL